ncbi:MAG: type II toxin-antitoxin system VapC family toxin [Desulfurococcales archaeon]|nr:type II toxin-antitoxin system VapC family toxin [Desulfurococcales archaeon]
MKALLDASALLNIIRTQGREALRYLRGSYVLTLTPYEVGNALWKEATLIKRLTLEKAVTLLNAISRIFNCLNVVRPSKEVAVLRLASELRLTYYDSSYVVVSAMLDVPLITDDGRLRERLKQKEDKVKELLQKRVAAYSSDEYLSMSRRSS